MITKSELEKMVDEAFKDFCSGTPYTFDSYSSNLFKSGASFTQGILMPEMERLTHLSDGRFHQIQSLAAKVKRYEEALEFYADKNNWVDLYAGAQLPLNLRKQSVINNEDIEHVEKLPGYSNECGGKKARAALNQTSEDNYPVTPDS